MTNRRLARRVTSQGYTGSLLVIEPSAGRRPVSGPRSGTQSIGIGPQGHIP